MSDSRTSTSHIFLTKRGFLESKILHHGYWVDLAEKLVHAKDLQEVLSMQSEYVKAQMAAIQSQSGELGEAVRKASGLAK